MSNPSTKLHSVRPGVALALAVLLGGSSGLMAQTSNRLGTAQAFGVLGASTVTNTGPTTIKGDLGVFPGTSLTGSGSITISGVFHLADGVAEQAQIDAMNAYNGLAALTVGFDMTSAFNLTGQDLGGMTLTPGVYLFSTSAQLTGNLTLDFGGNPDAEFVFLIGSTLTTASASSVTVIGGGTQSGIYWQVGSSATLGTSSVFAGNILALASVTMTTSAKISCGRAFALTEAVTLDNNVIGAECGIGDVGGDFGSNGFSPDTPVEVVPEPATLLLLGTGLAGLGAWRRRRRTSVTI